MYSLFPWFQEEEGESAPDEVKYVRHFLKSSFQELDCFLLPRPGDEVADAVSLQECNFDGEWIHRDRFGAGTMFLSLNLSIGEDNDRSKFNSEVKSSIVEQFKAQLDHIPLYLQW